MTNGTRFLGHGGEGNRTLAAIVFTDAVGFSAAMQADEDRALALLRADANQMHSICVGHGGEVLKLMGDGMLMYFASAVQAVRCALNIQTSQADRLTEAEAGGEPLLIHRIGIHLGDVIVEEGDVMGDGVNIASRLQTIADPGGICVSQSVIDIVKSKLPLHVRYLGAPELKNISEEIHAYAVTDESLVKPGERESDADAGAAVAAAAAASAPGTAATPSRHRAPVAFLAGLATAAAAALALAWAAPSFFYPGVQPHMEAPRLSLPVAGETFVEGRGPTYVVTPGAALESGGDRPVHGAVVTLLNGEPGDRLAAAGTSTISAAYDPAHFALSLSGIDAAVEYLGVLRTITFEHGSENPSAGARYIQIAWAENPGRDEEGESADLAAAGLAPIFLRGAVANRRPPVVAVEVVGVNDPPEVIFQPPPGGVLATVGAPLAALAGGRWSLLDPEGDGASGARVVIEGARSGDVLTASPPAGDSGVLSAFDAATFSLRFAGLAPLDDYRDLLRGVRFTPAPGEGEGGSAPRTVTLAVTVTDDNAGRSLGGPAASAEPTRVQVLVAPGG